MTTELVLELGGVKRVELRRAFFGRSRTRYLLRVARGDGSVNEQRVPYLPVAFTDALKAAQVEVSRSWW